MRRLGWGLALLLVLFAVIGPFIAPDPYAADTASGALHAPSPAHWLGTDPLSRDIFSRLAHGAQVSLGIAAIAIAVAAAIGSLLGLAAGTGDGPIARGVQRVINLGLALPRVIVLLVILSATGRVAWPLLGVVLGLTGWPALARMVRGEALRLRHSGFVAAARALGAAERRVVWHEIFPGTLPALLVSATLGVADVILLEAGLSFLGVGVPPPAASWGGMILDARDYLGSAPWLVVAPCVALGLATCAATLVGESLRQSLQPETR